MINKCVQSLLGWGQNLIEKLQATDCLKHYVMTAFLYSQYFYLLGILFSYTSWPSFIHPVALPSVDHRHLYSGFLYDQRLKSYSGEYSLSEILKKQSLTAIFLIDQRMHYFFHDLPPPLLDLQPPEIVVDESLPKTAEESLDDPFVGDPKSPPYFIDQEMKNIGAIADIIFVILMSGSDADGGEQNQLFDVFLQDRGMFQEKSEGEVGTEGMADECGIKRLEMRYQGGNSLKKEVVGLVERKFRVGLEF